MSVVKKTVMAGAAFLIMAAGVLLAGCGTTQAAAGSNIPVTQNTPLSADKMDRTLLCGDSGFCSLTDRIVSGKEAETEAAFHTGSTWYADPKADADTADGSQAHPFATVEESVSHLQAGDLLYLRGGVYSPEDTIELSRLHGNAAAYIQIAGYPGEKAVIDGSHFTGENIRAVEMSGTSYLWIKNLTLQNYSGPEEAIGMIMNHSANHILITGCEITGIRVDDPAQKDHTANAIVCYNTETTADGAAGNILIYDNRIHDCATGWSEAVSFDENTENVNVLCNSVVNTGNIGIDFAGNYYDDCNAPEVAFCRKCLAYGNYVADCIAASGIRCYGLYADGAQNITFHSNVVTGCSGGIEVGAEQLPDSDAHSTGNVQIVNNLVYGNLEKGITIGGYDTDTTGTVFDSSITGNTLFNNGLEAPDGDGAEITVSKVNGLTLQQNVITNQNDGISMISFELGKEYVKNYQESGNILGKNQ